MIDNNRECEEYKIDPIVTNQFLTFFRETVDQKGPLHVDQLFDMVTNHFNINLWSTIFKTPQVCNPQKKPHWDWTLKFIGPEYIFENLLPFVPRSSKYDNTGSYQAIHPCHTHPGIQQAHHEPTTTPLKQSKRDDIPQELHVHIPSSCIRDTSKGWFSKRLCGEHESGHAEAKGEHGGDEDDCPEQWPRPEEPEGTSSILYWGSKRSV